MVFKVFKLKDTWIFLKEVKKIVNLKLMGPGAYDCY